MELLIPGLILVALMAWASTKIKKRAADAFETETVEMPGFRLRKPEGFLHVIGDEAHEFSAYSREFGADDNEKMRQATIEVDVFHDSSLSEVVDSTKASGTEFDITASTGSACELRANEMPFDVFYKIGVAENSVYRLRFGVLSEHRDAYLRRIDETLESFEIKTQL